MPTMTKTEQLQQDHNILEVKNVKKYFPIKGGLLKRPVGFVKAVDDISLTIRKGETLGIVGESGSGKSTLGRTILRLLAATEGEIKFNGQPITETTVRQMRPFRKSMQMIFQDPFGSLNTKMSVSELIEEPLIVQTKMPKAQRKKKVEEMIQKVGLRLSDLHKYPHEFSGGQRQRISIARALVLEPKFLIGDVHLTSHRLAYVSQPLTERLRLNGTPEVTIEGSFDRSAGQLTVLLVDYGKDEAEIVTRGWMDARNRSSLWEKEDLYPGEPYTFSWELEPHDYEFSAGHRIGFVLISSDHEYTKRPKSGTEITVYPGKSQLKLPLVGEFSSEKR